jgi:cytochrome P450
MASNFMASPDVSIEQLLSPFPDVSVTEVRPPYYDAPRQMWYVFSYPAVHRVLTDHGIFSSDRDRMLPTMPGTDDPLHSSMIGLDPPRHTRLRTLVSYAFTPRTVARLEPRIHSIVQTLLDQVQGQGTMDVINDVAHPLPSLVIAELLGVPPEDRDQFRSWSDAYLEFVTPAALQGVHDLTAYFTKLLEQRRQSPRDDLMSALLTASIDGEQLSQQEIVGACMLLLMAGHETTRNLIGSTVLCLDAFPEAMASVVAHPEAIPMALEEVLRYTPPIIMPPPRITMKESIIDGQLIPAGQWIQGWIPAAHRDEDYFPHACVLDIQRTPNRHMGFGYGIHFCLGAALARLEARIALGAMLTRLPSLQRIRTVPLERIESPLLFGLKHLPITFHHV